VFSGATDVPATFAPLATSTTAVARTTEAATTTTVVAASSTIAAAAGPSPSTSTTTTSTSTTSTVPGPPRRVLLLGDSTGVALAEGLYRWAGEHAAQVQVASLARLGCGLVRGSAMFGDSGDRFRKNCDHAFDVELPAIIRSGVPDEVTIMVTLPDVVARTWSAGEGPLLPTDRRYHDRLHTDYDTLTDELLASGVARIVWVVPPAPSERWPQASVNPILPADWKVFVETIGREAVRHRGQVVLAHLDDWMAAHEPRDGSMRPDGLHLAPDAAYAVVDRFLGAVLLSRPTR
jgi:SGNH domain (fused to AT3 domains)